MGEDVASEVLPDVFLGVQFWRVRGQFQKNYVLRDNELGRAMPSGPIHDKQGDGSLTNRFSDFDQMLVHGFYINQRHDQGRANATGWADRAE